jgi:predicted lipid-binding transport protein (Tim44 family)
LQALVLIILAALAAVVLFQLYAVLGRRVGRGSDETPRTPVTPIEAQRPSLPRPGLPATASGLASLQSRDPSFDVDHFTQGARAAYQMIVKAFAAGEVDVLRPLLSPPVMESFAAAIDDREKAGRSESVEFLQTPRADFEGVAIKDDMVRASVRFLAEFRNRAKGPEGESVDDRRTAEVWTFERNLKSRDPNWTLIHVDAAEA